MLTRFLKLTIEEVLPEIQFKTKRQKVEFGKYSVNLSSVRLHCFKNSLVCAHCGIQGEFFAIETNNGKESEVHMNLYAVKDGLDVLMTKDHIIPSSKGGSDKLDNMQTMCLVCNGLKADKLEEKD